MLELYLEFTDYAVYLSVLLSVIGAMIYWRLDSTLKIFCIFLIVTGALECMSFALSYIQVNNLRLVHIYTLLELVILSMFFLSVFKKMKLEYPIKTITGVLLLLCILNSIFIQPLDTFNSYAATLVSLTLISYCILTFYHLLGRDDSKYNKIRWLVSGLLLYQMTSFVVMAFSNILSQMAVEVDLIVWFMRIVIMIVTKILFGAIILLAAFPKQKQIV